MTDQGLEQGNGGGVPTLSIASLRKRRGVVRASVTRTGAWLKDLEDTKDHPDTPAHAQLLIAKLESLDVDFKNLHLQIVDLLDDEEQLEREQLVLDSHDKVSMQMHILQQLCTVVKLPVDSVARNLISRKLAHLERVLISARDGIAGITDEHGDLSHFQEHLTERKSELASSFKTCWRLTFLRMMLSVHCMPDSRSAYFNPLTDC